MSDVVEQRDCEGRIIAMADDLGLCQCELAPSKYYCTWMEERVGKIANVFKPVYLFLEARIQFQNCRISDWCTLLTEVGGDSLELSQDEKILIQISSVAI
jgi:hypothetical protein